MLDTYEDRAKEAEDQARRANTEDERQTHLAVAKLWRELAERKRRKDQTEG